MAIRLTRAQDQAVFVRICTDLLQADADSPIRLAFAHEGIDGMLALLSVNPDDVDTFCYVPPPDNPGDPPGRPIPLRRGLRYLIGWLLRFYRHLCTINNGQEIDWMNLDPDDFDQYRISTPWDQLPITNPVVSAPVVQPRSANLVSEFNRGIRRDASTYPTLKDQRHWNGWNRAVISQARAHDVSEVFDPTFVPDVNDPVAQELFQQKQNFVYAVLNKTVQTDQGQQYVREHEHDVNAQMVYAKLLKYASTSTAAELAKDALVSYLTNSSFDSKWRGSTVGYLLHWKEQLRLLDEMLPSNEVYDANVKKRMLENSVKHCPELRAIKDMDNNRIATGGTPMTFDQYYDVLSSAAATRDDLLKLPTQRNQRVVQNLEYDPLPYTANEEEFFDRGYLDSGDSNVDLNSSNFLSVNVTNSVPRNNNRPYNRKTTTRLPRDIWERLPEESRLIIQRKDTAS
jgi:hypothetical protein